jgi:acetyl esterase/lipase
MKISIGFVIFLCSSISCRIHAENIQYKPVDSDVAYSKITASAYKEPDEYISYGEDPLQFASLWLPSEAKSKKNQLIVFIHGGCWLNAYDIKHSYALTTALAQEGYAVWSLEYRRSGDLGGGWPGTFDDILAGIKSINGLPNHAYTLNNTVVVGHSAGGHLALLAGSQIPELKAIIGLAAITDIVSYAEGQNSCQQATSQFMSGSTTEKSQQYKDANPIAHKMHEKTVLLQGDADNIVPPQQALALGVTVVKNAGAGHFDWIHPGSSAYQQLLRQLHDIFTQ